MNFGNQHIKKIKNVITSVFCCVLATVFLVMKMASLLRSFSDT